MGWINKGFFVHDSSLDAKVLGFIFGSLYLSLFCTFVYFWQLSPEGSCVASCPSRSPCPPPPSSSWLAEGPLIYFVFQEWNIAKLSIEYDSEPFGKERDAAIKKLASEAGVEVIVRISHTLYDLDK